MVMVSHECSSLVVEFGGSGGRKGSRVLYTRAAAACDDPDGPTETPSAVSMRSQYATGKPYPSFREVAVQD